MWKKFNLNNNVKVKVLKKGRERLSAIHNSFIGKIRGWEKRNSDYYLMNTDKDGYMTFHAWEFMNFFGEVMINGEVGYVDPNIQIEIPTPSENNMAVTIETCVLTPPGIWKSEWRTLLINDSMSIGEVERHIKKMGGSGLSTANFTRISHEKSN